MEFWEFLKELTNPQSIILHGGLMLLLLVIFAENGLIIGFFLPGDSLIFLAGLICYSKPELLNTDIESLVGLMFIAAVIGSLAGYYFGRRIGPPLFQRKDSFIFKKKYLELTKKYYDKHGGKTLIMGRFLPLIRTFAPIIAGVIKVPFATFMFYNLVGGALWTTSLCLIGYFLGSRIPGIENYVGHIIIGFIGVTNILVLRTYIKQRRETKPPRNDEDTPILMP